MKVFIIEISTKKIVAEVPINFAMANTNTTENDVFDEAWESAVEDKLVETKKRSKYKFELKKT